MIVGPAPRRIYVFGSNLAGRHGRGTALAARLKHGARYGQGEGLQGDSYAIPTKDRNLRPRSLAAIAESVYKFKQFAAAHPEWEFDICAVGCGLAGYKAEQIAPMFEDVTDNCRLPVAFARCFDK